MGLVFAIRYAHERGRVGCVAGMMFRTGEGGSIRGRESNNGLVAIGFWREFFLEVFGGTSWWFLVILGKEFCYFFFR